MAKKSYTRLPKGLSVGNKTDSGAAVTTEAVLKTFTIPINFADGTTETDTGYDLPTFAVVEDVYVRVKTAEATGTTKTIDFGTLSTESGDADGYMDGVSVAATGLIKTTLASTGQTRGALLRADESGAGVLVPEHDVASGGKSLSWTPGSNDFAELDADLIIVFKDVVNTNA